MLMALVIPVLRYVINWAWLYFGSGDGPDELRSVEAKRLSDWSAAVLCLCSWDGCVGYFKQMNEYRGVVVFAFDGLAGNEVTTTVFRIATGIFLWFCVMNAFERDFQRQTNLIARSVKVARQSVKNRGRRESTDGLRTGTSWKI